MLILQIYMFKLRSVYFNAKFGLYLLFNVLGFGPTALTVKERTKPGVLTKGVNDQFVNVNGIKLHYVEMGDRSRPLMLFVHGFPEFWYSWRHQLREFSKDYWCVALDQRGYNESDKPKELEAYKLVKLMSDLHELIKLLGKKPILVCHDWGSIIGFEYVMRHMDTVESYVMLCSPPRQVHREMSAMSVEQYHMMWYISFLQGRYIPELTLRSFDLRIFETLKSHNTTKEDIEAFKYVFGGDGALTPPINYYRANIGDALETVKPATYKKGLLLLAENDIYISKACGPAAERFVPNLKFQLMEDVDHFCQQKDPVVVNKYIRDFLKGV